LVWKHTIWQPWLQCCSMQLNLHCYCVFSSEINVHQNFLKKITAKPIPSMTPHRCT
jgi:hypothetical protein